MKQDTSGCTVSPTRDLSPDCLLQSRSRDLWRNRHLQHHRLDADLPEARWKRSPASTAGYEGEAKESSHTRIDIQRYARNEAGGFSERERLDFPTI